ncbi:MAG: MFS transporter [Rhodobacteraceae bacterium]|nr:MFS transporter [Paracoccaceae bacterium]
MQVLKPNLSLTAPARLATKLAFFTAGFAMGCSAPLFPFIKAGVGADEAEFGLLLLCIGLGAIIAMPITGGIAARYGARRMVLLGGAGLVVFMLLLTLANNFAVLAVVLFFFGAAMGTIDVAMNIHGVEVEAREKRPLMSGFHAQFSVGGLIGAALVTALLSLGAAWQVSMLTGAAITAATILMASAKLLKVRGGTPEPFTFPRGVVLLIAVLAAISFLLEGAVLDWGALLIIERKLLAAENAGVGFILFSVAMVLARLTGDKIVAKLGEWRVLGGGSLAIIAGIATLLLSPWPALAIAGFLLIGLGAANIVPILFSAAGRQKTMPASLAIASVTTVGYAGILLGPTAIGLVANHSSLPTAFWMLAALMLVIPLTAGQAVRAGPDAG